MKWIIIQFKDRSHNSFVDWLRQKNKHLRGSRLKKCLLIIWFFYKFRENWNGDSWDMRRAIQKREVISKKQTLTIACIWAFTALRMFFTFFFFVTSIICIVKSGSRIEKCKGQVSFSQKTIDALDTTSTFIETTFSSLLIFLLYRWKWFHFKNFLKALPKQRSAWSWAILWILRIVTNVLIDIIPSVKNGNYMLVVLGISLSFEFFSTTIFACAIQFVFLTEVTRWINLYFADAKCRFIWLYRIVLLTYGFRLLALFLYDSFLVARHIVRESEYKSYDQILLFLDAGYRGSLSYFFFGKFFEFSIPEEEEVVREVQLEEPNEEREAEGRGEIRGDPENDRELDSLALLGESLPAWNQHDNICNDNKMSWDAIWNAIWLRRVQFVIFEESTSASFSHFAHEM